MFYGKTMEWKREKIREESKERLMKDMLSQVILSPSDVHWFQSGKEIILEGRMFDIEKQELLSDGRIRFTGIYDQKETALNEQLQKQQKDEDQKNSRQLGQFFNDWQALPLTIEELFTFISADKQLCVHPDIQPTSAFRSILKPPPQA